MDNYSNEARKYKRWTKWLYDLLLLVGLLVIVLGVIHSSGELSNVLNEALFQRTILGLSLFGSVLASTAAYMRPAQRWQKLRTAALTLESEVWKFRTRTGAYSAPQKGYLSTNRDPERKLYENLQILTKQVYESAGVMDTTFAAKFEVRFDHSRIKRNQQMDHQKIDDRLTHGQSPSAGIHGTFGVANKVKKPKTGHEDEIYDPDKYKIDWLAYELRLLVPWSSGKITAKTSKRHL